MGRALTLKTKTSGRIPTFDATGKMQMAKSPRWTLVERRSTQPSFPLLELFLLFVHCLGWHQSSPIRTMLKNIDQGEQGSRRDCKFVLKVKWRPFEEEVTYLLGKAFDMLNIPRAADFSTDDTRVT